MKTFASRLSLALLLTAFATLAASPPDQQRAPPGPQNLPVNVAAYQGVYYVSPSTGSDGTGDGTKAKPWATLRAALLRAENPSGKHRCAVLVAAGSFGGYTLEMKPFIDLYGGHDPATWERDIRQHPSIIDGEKLRRPVIGANDSRIDGFVIRNGNSQGPGGGILCRRVNTIIANNVILDNFAIEPRDYIYGMFHQVGSDGGGIACVDGANATIINNVISRNSTGIGNGGGIGTRNYSLPTIENNVVCDNRTGLKDSDPDIKKRARSSNGGGISMSTASSLYAHARIANNLISGNRVGGNSDAGGLYCEYDSSPDITGNFLLNNTSEDDGAAIYVMKLSEPFIAGNVFAGNQGHGAIRLSKEGRGRIHNNVFFANPSGAICCVDAWMLCTNNTVADNAGGGISFINRHTPSMKPSVFMNNIVYGNKGSNAIAVESSDAPPISHCNIQGGGPGEGNFDSPPRFVEDGTSGPVKSIAYDAAAVQTKIVLGAPVSEPASWIGRVVRVGDRWSVIASVDIDQITAWGDLLPADGKSADQFEISPTYRLSDSSPCLAKGVAIPASLSDNREQLKSAGAVNVGATPGEPAPRRAESSSAQ